jgi:uncharacterized protein YecE (DUF72 family)
MRSKLTILLPDADGQDSGALESSDADDHTTSIRLTSNRTYVRLRKSAYSEADFRQWQNRMQAWREGGVDVFAFIKHDDNPDGPWIAEAFAAELPEPRSLRGRRNLLRKRQE